MERQADSLIARGLTTGNQTHLASGLQVCYNLGSLSSVIDKLLEDTHQKLRSQWTELLDIKRISDTSDSVINKSAPGK